jgi:hypothetical protein
MLPIICDCTWRKVPTAASSSATRRTDHRRIYLKLIHEARKRAFTSAEAASPLIAVPYSPAPMRPYPPGCGHRVTAQVADWAGHSIAVLLDVYARCVHSRVEQSLTTGSGTRHADRPHRRVVGTYREQTPVSSRTRPITSAYPQPGVSLVTSRFRNRCRRLEGPLPLFEGRFCRGIRKINLSNDLVNAC